jgi:hypothetical protein
VPLGDAFIGESGYWDTLGQLGGSRPPTSQLNNSASTSPSQVRRPVARSVSEATAALTADDWVNLL